MESSRRKIGVSIRVGELLDVLSQADELGPFSAEVRDFVIKFFKRDLIFNAVEGGFDAATGTKKIVIEGKATELFVDFVSALRAFKRDVLLHNVEASHAD